MITYQSADHGTKIQGTISGQKGKSELTLLNGNPENIDIGIYISVESHDTPYQICKIIDNKIFIRPELEQDITNEEFFIFGLMDLGD
ncbi:MAG: hypothetical protein IPL26_12995 [Leptospiraceae bacterium]|nr:hypothetical protein [Leptospiraceae bacterium]